MTYELHPLCTLFPRMSGAEFDSLRDDIKANGLRQVIVLHDGMILDGGNRYRACIEAGVKPRFVDFAGDGLVAFVLSQNMHRRHMTPGQQAAIVASAQDWAKAQGRGGDRKSDQSQVVDFDSVERRAAASGASRVTQMKADAVAKADPALAVQVGHGEVSLPAAVKMVSPPKPAKPKKIAPAPEPLPRDELQDLVDALTEDNARLRDENDTLRRVAEPTAVNNVAQLKNYIKTLESQRDDWMNQSAELKKMVKRLQRQLGEVNA